MKSILDKMGITPNAMQQDAMHALLRSDKDVVVLSPTGVERPWPISCPLPNWWMLAMICRRLLWLHQEENLPCSRLLFSRIWEVVCVPWLAMEAE